MAMPTGPFETLTSAPLQVAVLDSDGTIRDINGAWRAFVAAMDIDPLQAGIGARFLACCAPDQASGLADVIAGRCDVFTSVCRCEGRAASGCWMLMLAVPRSAAPPRRIAVIRFDLSAVLPFDPGNAALRAAHHPEVLAADATDAIVRAVEQALARLAGPRASGLSADTAAAAPRGIAATVVPASLPRRQRQVLALLGEGMSNAQIADTLGISMNTAKLHVSAVLRRLGLDNRMQAVALGARLHGERALVPALGAE